MYSTYIHMYRIINKQQQMFNIYPFRFTGVGHHPLCPDGVGRHPFEFVGTDSVCLRLFAFTKQPWGRTETPRSLVTLAHGITRAPPKVAFVGMSCCLCVVFLSVIRVTKMLSQNKKGENRRLKRPQTQVSLSIRQVARIVV